MKNKIRIIAGKWRRRQLNFLPTNGLRPTPDRVRETLFNWIAPDIQGMHCLDLFAGSGALGFEALSRGAANVTFVDTSIKVVQQLKENCQQLDCHNVDIQLSHATKFLKTNTKKFDLIFLDPPFQSTLLMDCLALLKVGEHLNKGALIYTEQAKRTFELSHFSDWQVLKQQKAGDVRACLLGQI